MPENSIERIATEDKERRELEVMRILGAPGLSKIEKALGLAPFHKLQTEEEALRIVEWLSLDKDKFGPINEILNQLSGPRRWALYLMTGFHAVVTHSNGHREMVQESVDKLPRAALLGGNSPRWLDVGIGNGNLLAAGMAVNPKALLYGLDVAGGSLSRSMAVLNSIADEVQDLHSGPKRADYGRFGLVRGSASDPNLLEGQRIDGATIVLTLFAIPAAEREQAFRLIAERLNPGGTVVLVDPVPAVSASGNPIDIVQLVVRSAFRNNEELTALDVAIVTAMNMHNLLKTDFLSAHQQAELGKKVGLVARGPAVPVYYGIASMQVFEKPWQARRKRSTRKSPAAKAQASPELRRLRQRVEDELRRRISDELTVHLADNSDQGRIEKFIRQERASFGVEIAGELEQDLRNIEQEYLAKGGFFFLIQDAQREIQGTFAFAPTGPAVGEIRKMYLAESCRRNGLGENIFDAILRFAVSRGLSSVYGETNEKLKSTPMLKSAGFVSTARPADMPVLLPDDGHWFKKRFPQ